MTFATQQTQNTLESGDSEHVLLEFEKSFMQMINVKLEKMWFVISSIVEATLLYLSACIFFQMAHQALTKLWGVFPVLFSLSLITRIYSIHR